MKLKKKLKQHLLKKNNYKNYFLYAYDKEKLKLPTGISTLRRKPKIYKE